MEQSSGRNRLNIHGVVNLETGQTVMNDVPTVDAISTIALLAARYHHAKLVQAWLARPGCRIKLHFVPAYCPHPRSASRLEPIERLWGLMHRHTTHNKCYATFKEFSTAMLTFLRDRVPGNWQTYCDEVSDNFRIINPKDFRILA